MSCSKPYERKKRRRKIKIFELRIILQQMKEIYTLNKYLPFAGSNEHGNEPPGFIKGGKSKVVPVLN
jgi:hypothetical protein